ncbi:hypothetical protein G9A89_012998 [Geosiphon pyriformis]|nr:hypothetical protein G9A89_012998 [Geosiphon pyriformis]
MATVGPSIAIIKKVIKDSDSGGGFKLILLRKKKKGSILEKSVENKEKSTKVPSGHLWSSKTGNTTKSNSIDMEEKCLVEETSFNYSKNSVFANKDPNQMLKELGIKTKKVLSKLLGKIDFSNHDIDDNVFLDASLKLLLSLKILVNVSVKKSFALNIGLNEIVNKMSQEKYAITVVLKKIPIGISTKAVHAALSEFGIIKSIKMQLVELWQKAVIEFEQVDHADLVAAKWCTKYKKMGHTSLSCSVSKSLYSDKMSCITLPDMNKSRLAVIYSKCLAPIAHLVAFGGVSWAKIIGSSLFFLFFAQKVSVNFGFSAKMKPISPVVKGIEKRFAVLENSFTSLIEQISELAKRLDLLIPTVFQSSSEC